MSEHQPAPAVRKLDVTIARLRLLVAEINARVATVEGQRKTYADQRDKLVQFGLYGDATLDTVLTMLADVEERLQHAEATGRALATIRKRAEDELESLQLTKGVEEARSLMSALQAGEAQSAEPVKAEIARLQALINEASERAARTIEKQTRH